MDGLILLVVVGISVFFYFIPTVVAQARKSAKLWGIFFVNLFFGWTLVGWVLALVWAVSSDTETDVNRRRSVEEKILRDSRS